ncbi:hypothetical protein DFA_10484 [Cavenderia fasciculata]|uniref:MACPF domain-containing protein n=1 Tax=Cavenderia fasciculata TaxID=261658 RepID=F4QAC3_CACFS|nr:uncharacterized protein DFA_10484 [Cavenderia fasciculata]EGG15642.1 hypothetical protein DFA_10484 [Cavenderia fasciculata]|eukprot:XP_004354384.1 hypothetical protein DFA_10484 [Cavenderia fasciculata]
MRYLKLLIVLSVLLGVSLSAPIYVGQNQGCGLHCEGTSFDPFGSIKEALASGPDRSGRIKFIFIKTGTYTGINNINILVSSSNLVISAENENAIVTIDCQSVGQAFVIEKQSVVTLNGIKIINCSSSKGSSISISQKSSVILDKVQILSSRSDFGSIYVSQSNLVVSNSAFNSNTAMTYGAAIYATQNSKIEIAPGSTFSDNKQLSVVDDQDQYVLFDITVDGAMATVDPTVSLLALCLGSNSTVSDKSTSTSRCSVAPAYTSPSELFGCQQSSIQCTSFFKGFFRADYLCSEESSCAPFQSTYQYQSPFPVLNHQDGPIKGKLVGYFTVPFDTFVSDPSSQTGTVIETNVYLIKNPIHKLTISYSSLSKAVVGQRQMTMEYRLSTDDDFSPLGDLVFYSQYVCGDGIYDPNEQCESDAKSYRYWNQNDDVVCGNGRCDELDPNDCIQDCFRYITQVCPPITTRKGRNIPMYVESDTVGDLLYNTFDWRLPGYQHLSFGFDLVTGEQQATPIFLFDFCSQKETNVVEDTYRGAQYQIPKEMKVVFMPQCSFTQTNKVWNNSEEIKRDMASKTLYSGSISASFSKLPAQVNAEYSQDSSYKRSSTLRKSNSGKIVESSVTCEISRITLTQHPLHPNFIADVLGVNSTNDAYQMIRKYGTHFYASATLGGTLKQFTSTTTSISETEVDTSKEFSSSFNIAVSSPVLDSNAAYGQEYESEESNEERNRFLSETERSTLLISGGRPGCFAPGTNANYGSWTGSVDLLPVPVNYQLLPIRSLIPSLWKTQNGTSIKEIWTTAESFYYKFMTRSNMFDLETELQKENYILYWFPHAPNPLSRNATWDTKINVNPYGRNGKQYFMTSIELGAIPLIDNVLDNFYSCEKNSSTSGCFSSEINIQPPFGLNLDPRHNKVYFSTFQVGGPAVVNFPTIVSPHPSLPGINVVRNVVISSGNTFTLPRVFMWDSSFCRHPMPIPVWTFNFFDSSSMLVQNSEYPGYLRIPAYQTSYQVVTITIHIGKKKSFEYVITNPTPNGVTKLVTLSNSQIAQIMVATSLDFTTDPPSNIDSSENGVLFIKDDTYQYIALSIPSSQSPLSDSFPTPAFQDWSVLRNYDQQMIMTERDFVLDDDYWQQFAFQLPSSKFFPLSMFEKCDAAHMTYYYVEKKHGPTSQDTPMDATKMWDSMIDHLDTLTVPKLYHRTVVI